MKNIYKIFLIILVILTCSNSYPEKQASRDKLTYELINCILKDNEYEENGEIFIAENNRYLPPPISNFKPETVFLASLFNENDTSNLLSQLKLRKSFKIDSTKIGSNKIIPKDFFEENRSKDSFWEKVKEKYNGGFYIISMPIYSSDNSLVFIRFGYMCGNLCGGGQSRLYRYINGKWEIVKTIESWVS